MEEYRRVDHHLCEDNDDDPPYDSGEEMDRYLAAAAASSSRDGGADNDPAEIREKMKSNAIARRKRADALEALQDLREHREALSAKMIPLSKTSSREPPLKVHLDDRESVLMAEALKPFASRVVLAMGNSIGDIARAAGVGKDVPIVDGIADSRLMRLLETPPNCTKIHWYFELGKVVMSNTVSLLPVHNKSLVWTAQEVSSSARDELHRDSRNREATAARKRRSRATTTVMMIH